MEKPTPSIHRLLLSTSSRLGGEFDSPDISIVMAWPNLFSGDKKPPVLHLSETVYSRNFFVVSLNIEDPDEGTTKPLRMPSYSYYCMRISALMSMLYGKRVTYHGFLVSHGFFCMPDLSEHHPSAYCDAGPNSFTPRKDLEIPLDLKEFQRVAPLVTDEQQNQHFLNILFAAGRFYERLLRMYDTDPEYAYLDLVTFGGILQNYYEFTEEELYDDKTRLLFNQVVAEMKDGEAVVKQIKGSMRQLKRAYTLTITRLLTDYFFACLAESVGAFWFW